MVISRRMRETGEVSDWVVIWTVKKVGLDGDLE